MAWQLSARIYRLSLDVFRYHAEDLLFMTIELVTNIDGWPVAVLAHELASRYDVIDGMQGRPLHGLYMMPTHPRQGINRWLTQRAVGASTHAGLDGVAVRAWRDVTPFFLHLGFTPHDDSHDADGSQSPWRALS